MRILAKQCSRCNRIQVRQEKDNLWTPLKKLSSVEELKQGNELLSFEKFTCSECATRGRSVIAEMAGQTC
jgi:hypothetical protein